VVPTGYDFTDIIHTIFHEMLIVISCPNRFSPAYTEERGIERRRSLCNDGIRANLSPAIENFRYCIERRELDSVIRLGFGDGAFLGQVLKKEGADGQIIPFTRVTCSSTCQPSNISYSHMGRMEAKAEGVDVILLVLTYFRINSLAPLTSW
jgi:hypothetical protein